ncbi:MAG: hypothetical protein IJK67_02625 [Bacilli bacterium]|nr:hypothetical protein [Bacilli bacterium]
MNIIETDKYKKSYSKLLKRCTKEKKRIQDIKDFLIGKNNLHEVLIDPFKIFIILNNFIIIEKIFLLELIIVIIN